MSKLYKHLKTIYLHRKYVRQMCWKMKFFWQGITHDLSKYSIAELRMYKYWTGKGSPHQACREVIGYSPSWIHHYHKNKHHFQYWWDEDELGKIIPIKMPYKYVIESFCDMVGASKAYNLKNWNEEKVWNYWITKCKGKRIMNSESEYLVEKLIWNLKEYKLNRFIEWYNNSWKKYLKPQYEQGTLSQEGKLNETK